MKNRILNTLIIFNLTFIIQACNSNSGVSNIQKIFDTNDMIIVKPDGSNITPELSNAYKAVGIDNSGCTVTHIGKGIVVGAGHCYNGKIEPEKNIPCKETIKWNYNEGNTETDISKCVSILELEWSYAKDLVIYKVNNTPQYSAKIASTLPNKDDSISILGYPNFNYLTWSNSCKILELFKPTKIQLKHLCDTEPGNSGSPIFNSMGEIIAIHSGGNNNYNYASIITKGSLKIDEYNL